MTQTELIDYIQQMHPAMSDADARSYLNDASKEFCRRTGLLEDTITFTTTSGNRWYDLADLDNDAATTQIDILEVIDVYLGNNRILKLSGTPDVFDVT